MALVRGGVCWWQETTTKCMTRSLNATPKTTLRSGKSEAYITIIWVIILMRLTTDGHKASRCLSATAGLLVRYYVCGFVLVKLCGLIFINVINYDGACWNLMAILWREPAASLWVPAQRKRATMLYFANVYLFIFLWLPYSPALVNGGSRKFYTW